MRRDDFPPRSDEVGDGDADPPQSSRNGAVRVGNMVKVQPKLANEGGRVFRSILNVNAEKGDGAGVLDGGLSQEGSLSPAGKTPRCPHIDNDGKVGGLERFKELGGRYLGDGNR